MKRSPKSDFDDSGVKWFESPAHKEMKINKPHPGGFSSTTNQDTDDISESGESSYSRDEKELNIKMLKEKFYDFIKTLSKFPELKIDYNYLNQNLTIKIDKILDIHTICEIFEKLCARVLANPRIKKNWSEEETTLFVWITLHYCHVKQRDFTSLEDTDWVYISSIVPGKKSEQCKYRWQSLLKVNLSKVPWTQKEDEILVQIIKEKGTKQWKDIAKELNSRTGFKHYRHGKQCRERWINHLDPAINRGSWTTEEDIGLLKCQLEMGKKWAEIAKALGSRTENAVKNRWNSLIKKYRVEFGIEGDQIAAQTLLRKSTNYTTDEIERKICLMIIEAKEREINPEGEKQNLKKIEETSSMRMSQEYDSQTDTFEEKLEEEKPEKLRSDRKKARKNVDVDKSKNLLRDLVNQERETVASMGINNPQNINLVNNNAISVNANPMTNINQMNNVKYLPFSNPFNLTAINNMVPNPLQMAPNNKLPTAPQTTSIDANKLIAHQNALLNAGVNPMNQAGMPNMVNPQYPLGNIFNLNDMLNLNILFLNSNPNNMLKANQANILAGQAAGVTGSEKGGSGTVSSNTNSGVYSGSQGNKNLTMATSFFSEDQQRKDAMEEVEQKAEENASRSSLPGDNDDKSNFISLKQVPYNDFKVNESTINNNQIYYAMVDLSSRQICYVAPVTKETAPPMMLQNKMPSNPNSFGSMTLGMGYQPSPVYSPHPANLFSSPLILFNNPNLTPLGHPQAPIKSMSKEFTNMHISKSIESSPDISRGAIRKDNPASNEWTPEIEPQKIYANLSVREQVPSGTFDFGTPEANSLFGKNSGGPFRRQPQLQGYGPKEEYLRQMGLGPLDVEKLKSIGDNALFERLKTHDSPSLFLNTSNRNLQ